MKPYFSLLSLFLFACATPTKNIILLEEEGDNKDTATLENEDTSDNETTEDNTNTGDSTDLSEPDTTPNTEETDDNLPNDNTTSAIQSGTWFVNDATMIEDTCGWDGQLRQFFGIGTDALLPSTFTVQGEDGSFTIQADSYGAADPITCILEGTDFSCETQSVTPLDFDLGTYGWTYAIDFSGTTSNSGTIIGVAETTFPTISDWLVPVFQSMGIDHTQCVQSFELSLSID